jgi:hypothetical protein
MRLDTLLKCVNFLIEPPFFDFGGSLPRSFSSVFSTESLVVSAMAISVGIAPFLQLRVDCSLKP